MAEDDLVPDGFIKAVILPAYEMLMLTRKIIGLE